MAYAAFGSYLWNELLRRLLRAKISDLKEVEAESGTFLFWHRLDEPTLAYLRESKTAYSGRPECTSRMTSAASVYCQLLEDNNLSFSSFRTRALSRVFFRSFERQVLLYPQELQVIGYGQDELYPKMKSLVLSFTLPRGAFATMLIKRITLKD